jgi:trehalose 6-phosphate phosphatase
MLAAEPHSPDETMADLPPPPADLTGISLFLDFDGTLVDLAPRPDAVEVGDALRDRLDRLAARLPGRVAIVSGRSIAQLDAMLGDHARRLTVAGSHGAERRPAGADALDVAPPPALAPAAAELEQAAGELGLIFERKSFGAALHYRGVPEQEAAATAAAERAAAAHGLVLQRGKMMVEVRAPGDKGQAVRALAAEPGAAGTRPLFFGDDVTDEDGFEAAAELGGAGVLVGAPRATAALHRLDDPAALLAWLDRACVTGEAA